MSRKRNLLRFTGLLFILGFITLNSGVLLLPISIFIIASVIGGYNLLNNWRIHKVHSAQHKVI